MLHYLCMYSPISSTHSEVQIYMDIQLSPLDENAVSGKSTLFPAHCPQSLLNILVHFIFDWDVVKGVKHRLLVPQATGPTGYWSHRILGKCCHMYVHTCLHTYVHA